MYALAKFDHTPQLQLNNSGLQHQYCLSPAWHLPYFHSIQQNVGLHE
nr:hypothetical protein Iba_chr12aCG6240 [Ipomoea batatas]